MTADERLVSVRSKIERAKKHIADLKAAIQSFLDSKPYRVSSQRNPNTRQMIYYLGDVRPVPATVALIAGDAIQNLMSALDHLAYQIVMVGTNDRPPNPFWIYFPIAGEATKYEATKNGKIKGARPSAIKAIDALKPYKGGNDAIWALHRLNSIDKHRLLLTVGSMYGSVDIGPVMQEAGRKNFEEMWPGVAMPEISVHLRPANPLFPLKKGDVLFADAPDAKFNEKLKFTFDVALREPEVVESKSLFETVHQHADLVEGIVSALKSELV